MAVTVTFTDEQAAALRALAAKEANSWLEMAWGNWATPKDDAESDEWKAVSDFYSAIRDLIPKK